MSLSTIGASTPTKVGCWFFQAHPGFSLTPGHGVQRTVSSSWWWSGAFPFKITLQSHDTRIEDIYRRYDFLRCDKGAYWIWGIRSAVRLARSEVVPDSVHDRSPWWPLLFTHCHSCIGEILVGYSFMSGSQFKFRIVSACDHARVANIVWFFAAFSFNPVEKSRLIFEAFWFIP